MTNVPRVSQGRLHWQVGEFDAARGYTREEAFREARRQADESGEEVALHRVMSWTVRPRKVRR